MTDSSAIRLARLFFRDVLGPEPWRVVRVPRCDWYRFPALRSHEPPAEDVRFSDPTPSFWREQPPRVVEAHVGWYHFGHRGQWPRRCVQIGCCRGYVVLGPESCWLWLAADGATVERSASRKVN